MFPETAEAIVCDVFAIRPEVLRGRLQGRQEALPRFCLIYCLRWWGVPCKQLGREFGRDHTTIIYAARDGFHRWRRTPDYRRKTDEVIARLQAEGYQITITPDPIPFNDQRASPSGKLPRIGIERGDGRERSEPARSNGRR